MIVGSFGAVVTIVDRVESTETFDFISGELLVGFTDDIDVKKYQVGDFDPVLSNEITQILESINVVVVSISEGKEEKYIRLYEQSDCVRYAEKNGIISVADYPQEPNDPRWGDQYGPKNINCPEAWSYSYSTDVTIAIVDTGVDYTHEDLEGRFGGNKGYDYVSDDENPMDTNSHSHGTHCAGIAAAMTDNGKGIAGVAGKSNKIKLIAVRVLGEGGGTAADVADGIGYAASNADVISMSLGCTSHFQTIEDACDDAWDDGCILVAAAGNDGNNNDNTPHYPSNYDNVLSVAAIDSNDKRPTWSNFGSTTVDLAAPGVHILSTTKGDSYNYLSGTSMACPHVAGVCALGLARGFTRGQVMEKLETSAIDIGDNNRWQWGKVDARLGDSNSDIRVDVSINQIKLKDAIDFDNPLTLSVDESKPEWSYKIGISLEGSDDVASYTALKVEEDDLTCYDRNGDEKFNEDDFITVSNQDGTFVRDLKLNNDHGRSNNWGTEGGVISVHSLNIEKSEVGGEEILADISIKLIDADDYFLGNADIADISAKKPDNAGEPDHRIFTCTYDLLNDVLVDDGGSKKIGSGEFPRETAGWFDGSQHPGEPLTDIHEDDEWLSFTITDTYEAVEADAGGPYNGIAGVPITLIGSADNGTGPFEYSWDLDNDGQYDDATDQSVEHTFHTLGDHTIGLKVIDDFGIEDTTTTTVNIETNADPSIDSFTGETDGAYGQSYTYTVRATDNNGDHGDKLWYKIDWGDEEDTDWQGPYEPGEEFSADHSWDSRVRNLAVTAYVKDKSGDSADDSQVLRVTMPKTKSATNPLISELMSRFPFLKFFFPFLEPLLLK